MRMNWRNKCT